MLAKVTKLLTEPAFRAEPFTVLARGVALAATVALRREPILRLTAQGERLRVPADLRFTTMTAFLLRDWAEPELRRLDRFLRPGDTFLDVGANIGLFALKGARIVGPGGRVIAAEPGRVSADRLEANLALNDFTHVEVLRQAISDRVGTAGLHYLDLGNDPQAFSLLSDGSGVAAETVPTTTLDQLAADLALTRLDCVKLDVEGAEPLIVAGGAATLSRLRPIVVFEVNSPPAVRSGQPALAAERLMALGYRLHRLVGDELTPVTQVSASHGNLVALHPQGVPLAA